MEMEGLKIWLFVEHERFHGRLDADVSKSLYMIEPPREDYEEELDSDGFMIDPIISPFLTLDKEEDELLESCAMVRLGSRLYFFGGKCFSFSHRYPPPIDDELKRHGVYYVDFNDRVLRLQPAASLNAPKETPCVFSARGMIYALGSSLGGCNYSSVVGRSGIFEKYDPVEDKWVVLPDPPPPFTEMEHGDWSDTAATLIRDSYVVVGNVLTHLYLIFDLNTENWVPETMLSSGFPHGSLCVHDSLYYLTGLGTLKSPTEPDEQIQDEDAEECFIHIVKRGPLFFLDDPDPSRLLHSPCFSTRNRQVMARLDQHIPLLEHLDWCQWSELFHLGEHIFCSVVTSPIVNTFRPTYDQPYCRGVWIFVFQEVELPASKSTRFRTLAFFSYRIRTPFYNTSPLVRCCASGSLPDSWVKEPPKKKQVVNKRKTVKDKQIQHAHGSGSMGRGALAVAATDEIARLKAELAEKNALLKTMELLLSADRHRSEPPQCHFKQLRLINIPINQLKMDAEGRGHKSSYATHQLSLTLIMLYKKTLKQKVKFHFVRDDVAASVIRMMISLSLLLSIILHFTPALPLNKQLYTFNYVCITSGEAALTFSSFYILIYSIQKHIFFGV